MTTSTVLLLVTLGFAGVIEKVERRGPVQATVRLEPDDPWIGDPVTLEISVVADPNVELLMPEFGEALDRFTILDFVPRAEVTDDHRTRSTQTYRLQPTMSGRQSIPPILIEFVDHRPGHPSAPKGEDAFELLTPRMDFAVRSVLPKNASNELKPPLGELQPRGVSPTRKVTWTIVIATLLLLAAALPLLRWVHRFQRLARRRSAYDIARARLDQLMTRPVPDSEAIEAYFVELSDTIRHYLEDRFELRAPELTTEEFLETVSDSSLLSREHQSLLRRFLRQADLVKFAGLKPAGKDIQEALAAADRFVEDTRENAPLIEEHSLA